MPKVSIYNLQGKKIEELDLDPKVFGIPLNFALVHQVYRSIAANQRTPIAHTKNRAERAGSGAKPWKQKGTGRARVGSVRTPIWRKGGIVFGPTADRNFKKKINKKVNRKAISMVLSNKAAAKELVVVDTLKLKESKTKKLAGALKKLKINKSVLVGYSPDEKIIQRTGRNIKQTTVSAVDKINVFDMLNHRYLLISKTGIERLKANPKGKTS